MIYDCFPFFGELDILEIRLNEMDQWVDFFVLVESKETFSGVPRPLWFDKNKDRFESFLPKIIYKVAPVVASAVDTWERQRSQRNCAVEALTDCSDHDLILVGDVDEIVRGRDFTKIQGDRKEMHTFMQRNYFYYLNLLRPGPWPGTVMMPYRTLKSSFDSCLWKARKLRRKGIKKGDGWHFSNIGGKDVVTRKLKASSHFSTGSYQRMINDDAFLYDMMEGTRTIKGRKLRVTLIDDSYPIWLRENLDKFKYLLTKEEKG